ncbi:hypothetical protein MTO96_012065 [Rhipicephalus appendiculatus]
MRGLRAALTKLPGSAGDDGAAGRGVFLFVGRSVIRCAPSRETGLSAEATGAVGRGTQRSSLCSVGVHPPRCCPDAAGVGGQALVVPRDRDSGCCSGDV